MSVRLNITPITSCWGVADLKTLTAAKPKSGPKGTLKSRPERGLQYAVLPYGFADGLRILLVTSRETRRWVIPKGWPMRGKKPFAAAAREAFEEAGLKGRIQKTAIGAYHYIKVLKNGAGLACEVKVFPMEVTRQLKQWPEKGQRTAHWFAPDEAAEAVQELELAALIEAFAAADPKPRKRMRKFSQTQDEISIG